MPKPKLRKCAAGCGTDFVQSNSMVKWCSAKCGAKLALATLEKNRIKEKSAKRVENFRAKRAFYDNDKPYQLKRLQATVNKYVTYVQEAGKPCYTCGFVFGENKVGGVFDCGHSFTVGAHPELRFETRLMRRQCVSCNRYKGGMPDVFKAKLRDELGSELFDELTMARVMPKLTCSHLIEERKRYNRLLRQAGITPP